MLRSAGDDNLRGALNGLSGKEPGWTAELRMNHQEIAEAKDLFGASEYVVGQFGEPRAPYFPQDPFADDNATIHSTASPPAFDGFFYPPKW